MTTPDIAGLCERLRADTPVHNRGPDYEPIMVAPGPLRLRAANTIERQAAEIERLREALEEAAKTLEHVDGALMDMAEAGAVPAVGTWGFVTKAARKARAALTGEDTATLGLSGKTQTDARTRGDA
jgi:hypothetical protein